MLFKKKWGFGLGTIFSFIVIYFIYLYSKDKGWGVLSTLSKWYLIIIGVLIALPLIIFLLVILFFGLFLLIGLIKLRLFRKKYKDYKNKNYKKTKSDHINNYVDAEYEIKE